MLTTGLTIGTQFFDLLKVRNTKNMKQPNKWENARWNSHFRIRITFNAKKTHRTHAVIEFYWTNLIGKKFISISKI